MTAKSILLDKLTLRAPHFPHKQSIPSFVYGTAWKKEATTGLVYQALSNGFTGIDTANQPKHYREDLVGEGLRKAMSQHSLRRADLYIQTKFTPVGGQDPGNIPYDPRKSITEQVKQSVHVSLKHFDTSKIDGSSPEDTYIDSLVLHSPLSTINETLEAWQTLETYVPKSIRNLGISNCDASTLVTLDECVNIKPAVVQNRFYPRSGYDVEIRKFCQEKGIIYQSFWTLSANPALARSSVVQQVAAELNISIAAALYCMVLSLEGIAVLNGTTNVQHMKEDWTALSLAQEFSTSQPGVWQSLVQQFKQLTGQAA